MRRTHDEFDDLAFDEIESMRRRARNRKLAQMRVDSRNHYGPGDDDDDALGEDKWADIDDDYDDYNEDEWDKYS